MTKSPNTTDKEQQEAKIEPSDSKKDLIAQMAKETNFDKHMVISRRLNNLILKLECRNNKSKNKNQISQTQSINKTGGNKPGLSSQR